MLTRNLFYGQAKTDFELEVKGRWPEDIDGYVFNVGPDRQAPGGHWFTGQGVLCRVSCRPGASGRIRVDFRRVHTPLDEIRGRMPHLFRRHGVQEVSPFGFSNFANTNVQSMEGRLFLGYDVGRPIEVDPETLEYITPVGANDEWLQTLPAPVEPMIAVAAHPGPAWDEGALYFANYEMIPLSPDRGVRVCRWDLEGPVEHWLLEGVAPFDSIHDVKATRDYVVISDLPFVAEPMGPDPERGRRPVSDHAQLWIISKRDLRRTPPGSAVPYRHLSIPMMAGHMAIDYDDSDGKIVAYLIHHPMVDLPLAVEPGDRVHGSGEPIDPAYEGLIPVANQPTGIGRHVIDAEKGALLESRIAVDAERFWGGALAAQNAYDDDARAHVEHLWMSSAGYHTELVSERWWQTYSEYQGNLFVAPRDFPRESIPGAVARFDTASMELADLYAYEDGAFPHPPTFVPRIDARDASDGYILVPIHQDGDKELHLFDARALSAGPVARASAAGFNPPLLLHSWWSERRAGERPSSYRIDPEQDAWNTLARFAEEPAASMGIGRAIYEMAGGNEGR